MRSVYRNLNCSGMKDSEDEDLKRLGLKLLAQDGEAQVVAAAAPFKDFNSLDAAKKGRFVRIMKAWCVGQKLTPEMFNYNEGRSTVLLQAFKGFKHRFYGFSSTIGKVRTFVIVRADLSKKQNKADPNILNRALEIADGLQSEIDADVKGKGQ